MRSLAGPGGTDAGQHVLDLFAYTGTYTVFAAAGGAAETTTVDWFDSHLNWAQDNLALNGLERSEQQMVTQDPLEFLRSHRGGPAYDLAIVNAPASCTSGICNAIIWKCSTACSPC